MPQKRISKDGWPYIVEDGLRVEYRKKIRGHLFQLKRHGGARADRYWAISRDGDVVAYIHKARLGRKTIDKNRGFALSLLSPRKIGARASKSTSLRPVAKPSAEAVNSLARTS